MCRLPLTYRARPRIVPSIMIPTVSPRAKTLSLASLLGVLAFAAAAPAAAQTLHVTAETENFRARPRGEVVAEVVRGTELELVESQGQWRQATLRGWIWEPSVSSGAGNRVTVSADGGENLRATPNGDVVARLAKGTVATRLDARDRWVRVERTAWIWGASVEQQATPAGRAVATQPPARPDTAAARRAAGRPDSTAARPPAPAGASAPASGWIRAGQNGGALLSTPDGDTLARVAPMATLGVVARQGNWTRVRLEGWIWTPPGGDTAADSGAVLRNVTPATVAATPESFRGRVVEWKVQFIALERAEKIRTDFYEGEPFILARSPGDEPSFVYIAVPPDRVPAVEKLTPLETITVLGRIRTGRARLMGAPVLDLLEMRRD